jgi:hypothetical protein
VIHTLPSLTAATAGVRSPEWTATSDWSAALPVLQAEGVTLRELRLSDSASLLAFLATEEVSRFLSPPPTSIAGFERFIEWA